MSARSVWIVYTSAAYESDEIVSVHSTKAKAERECERLMKAAERANQRYNRWLNDDVARQEKPEPRWPKGVPRFFDEVRVFGPWRVR